MPDRPAVPEFGRREFLKRVGAASLGMSLAGAGVLAQTPAPPQGTPAVKPDSTSAPAPPKPPSEDAVALAAILKRRFPDRLSPEEWESVTRGLEQRLESGRRLRALRLANGDEPDFTFRV